MELTNESSSNTSRKIKLFKDNDGCLVLDIETPDDKFLTIILNKDYKESEIEALDLKKNGYINPDLSDKVSNNIYVSSLLSLHSILLESKIVPGEPVFIEADIFYIPVDDIPEEITEEVDSLDDIAVSMELNFDIDIDEESNMSILLPRLMREITSLVLLLNYKLLDYTV